MENEKKDTLKRIQRPDTMPIYANDSYDDEDSPTVDLPKNSGENSSEDVIPDDVPRKDGPGGEDGGM